MKIDNVISVKQPWAHLLCAGIKGIENRTWALPEKHQGERVLIHSSADKKTDLSVLTKEQYHIASCILEERNQIPCIPVNHWPRSAIIGSVRFVDCIINHPSIWAEQYENDICPRCGTLETFTQNKENICLMCDYRWGRRTIYNWVVADPILFDKPILNVKGKLGFWDYPADILVCPQCGGKCLHDNTDIGVPHWGNPVHICEHCDYTILESEF